MQGYKHILLAVDFADHNDMVTQRAKTLATQFQAKLSIVHVTDSMPITNIMDGQVLPIDMELSDTLMELSKKRLAELGNELGIASEDQWLMVGAADSEIVALAADNHVDLIVMGSHARHGLALLLGSTANGVLHHATCDVLAVRI